MYIGKNKVNLTFTPSLEHRTLANIAITLWNQDDVRDLMSKSALHILHKNWQGIEKVVIDKSFKLQLPQMLNERLLGFIVRVGLQILSWVYFHYCECSLITELPATFVWTSLGTIDNIKTSKLLMMGDTLDVHISFALACMYCMENEIKYYWNMVQSSRHKFKYDFIGCVPYWNRYMKQLQNKEFSLTYSSYLMTPHTSFICGAISNGSVAATRYFFNMSDMKNYDVVNITSAVLASKLCNLEVISLQRYSDIMMFLLSKMNAEQKANMIVSCTYAFLKCLLVWPWHSLFLEMSKDNWNSLSKEEYCKLLCNMVDLMCYEHNLHRLFGEFWQQSPKAYKQFVADQGNIVHLLINLHEKGDEKNLKLILKDSSIPTKENIFNIESKQIFIYFVFSKKWDSIEFLIQECLSSREELIRFRDIFKNVQHLISENEFCKGGHSKRVVKKFQWDKFFQLVDGCIFRYNNKRKCIESNSSLTKYWCKDVEK